MKSRLKSPNKMHCFHSFEITHTVTRVLIKYISVFDSVDDTNDYFMIMHNCLNKERFILTCDGIHYKIISYFEDSFVSYI